MGRKVAWPKFFLIIVCFTVIVWASGCSQSSSGESSDNKLTVWLWPGMGIEDQIKQYAEENDIEIEIQLAEFNDVHNNLTTALAAGSGAPDVAAIEVKGIVKYLDYPEHFYNLLDFGADEVSSDYFDWKWKQAMTPDGKAVIGLPTDIGPQAMAYRTDVFEAAGLPTDREEVAQLIQTWDDYLEIGEQIKEKTGKAMIDNASALYSVIEGQGKEKYYDENGQVIVSKNPQLKKAYDYTMQLIEKDLSASFDGGSTEWGTGLTNGDFATVMMPAWQMVSVKANAPNADGKWDLTQIPEGSGNQGGSFLTIPKQSDNPEEAYKLIKWLLSPEQQQVTFEEKGNFPSTPETYETEALQNFTDDYFSGAPVGKIYAQAAERVKPVIEGKNSINIEKIMTDAVVRVEDGLQRSEESWERAMDKLKRYEELDN
ncbi:extracellular solute-binding protein [uncultured Metabacillus sp.]|uniref:ABC transporter substrate-binding protein n=1 Tax=uncultured Metabacillus sp. TaxID=2860135 RepID=UPI00261E7666|nr:extracellular solute-binding protein [uncultured Metabacillus sp.]